MWARSEVAIALAFLKGSCSLSLPEEVLEDTPERKVITRYTPLGVAVGIVPWNYPVFIACGKIGPALLTGNAFILKPSPYAPYSCLKLVELGIRFFPPGILQALSGENDLGPRFSDHPDVDMISFTGNYWFSNGLIKTSFERTDKENRFHSSWEGCRHVMYRELEASDTRAWW